jgi:hypothetical protein
MNKSKEKIKNTKNLSKENKLIILIEETKKELQQAQNLLNRYENEINNTRIVVVTKQGELLGLEKALKSLKEN